MVTRTKPKKKNKGEEAFLFLLYDRLLKTVSPYPSNCCILSKVNGVYVCRIR